MRPFSFAKDRCRCRNDESRDRGITGKAQARTAPLLRKDGRILAAIPRSGSERPGQVDAVVGARFAVAANAILGRVAIKVEVAAADVADARPLVVTLIEQVVDAGIDLQVVVEAIAAEQVEHGI